MRPSIRCVHDAQASLGEGPVWVDGARALFWVDIHGRRIHRYDPSSGDCASYPAPFRVSSLAPRAGGGFVGGSERGFVLIDAALERFEVVAHPEPQVAGNRFNDGALDPQGRFWAGTMDDAEKASTGSLYRLDPDLRWGRHDTGYQVPNGPAFSPDGAVMYHTDSAARTVYRFRLAAGGDLRDKAPLACFGPEHGYPDGMTTAADGCLWIAFWDGWCLRRLSPNGEIVETVPMPVQRPTSCAFGGERLETLFVTSASVGLDQAALAAQPNAGGLFSLERLGTGLPTRCFGALAADPFPAGGQA